MLSVLGRALCRAPREPSPDTDCEYPSEDDPPQKVDRLRSFDMGLVEQKCLERLLSVLQETEAFVFGGAACYWAQKQELSRSLSQWLGWEDLTRAEFQNPRLDPQNYRARTSLKLPNDVDIWLLSPASWDEVTSHLCKKLPGIEIEPCGSEGPVSYSSSPFPKAFLLRKRYRVRFDLFASLKDWEPWPQALIAPLYIKLDCVLPANPNLPLFVSWPWQLAPFPNKAKSLGYLRGQLILADDTTSIRDVICRVSSSWQPFRHENSDESTYWKLWQDQQGSGGCVAQEMSARCGIQTYVDRLLIELSQAWVLKDAPFLLEDEQIVLVTDQDRKQPVRQLRETLREWTENPCRKPDILCIKGPNPRMRWCFPWDVEGQLVVDLILE